MNSLTSSALKAHARKLGADLVGIAAASTLDQNPPDPNWPQTPGRIWQETGSVIVLAKRVPVGLYRARDPVSQMYTPHLVMNALDRIALDLAYWLEDQGCEALPAPQQLTDVSLKNGTYGPLSLRHAAVEAGLGSLGLNMMLVTPQYGPRVYLAAVLTNAVLEQDRQTGQLCRGVSCGLCLLACPGDAVEHWGLNKRACSGHAQKYGVSSLIQFLKKVAATEELQAKQSQLGSLEMVNYWQALKSGAGAYGGCPTCLQVCPVGEDHQRLPKFGQKPDDDRRARRRLMRESESRGEQCEGYRKSLRWLAPGQGINH